MLVTQTRAISQSSSAEKPACARAITVGRVDLRLAVGLYGALARPSGRAHQQALDARERVSRIRRGTSPTVREGSQSYADENFDDHDFPLAYLITFRCYGERRPISFDRKLVATSIEDLELVSSTSRSASAPPRSDPRF
jgi:hypothetical protein